MNKRQRKKQAYKQYIRAIFEGYETMLEDNSIKELHFSYLKEVTYLNVMIKVRSILRRKKSNSQKLLNSFCWEVFSISWKIHVYLQLKTDKKLKRFLVW